MSIKLPSNSFIDIHSHHEPVMEGGLRIFNLFVSEISDFPTHLPVSIGLHPWRLGYYNNPDEALETLENYASNDHVLAIGEAGIDKVVKASLEEQERLFRAQVKISESLKKPMILHCVKAFNEVLKIRKDLGARQAWIFHGFNSKLSIAEQLVSKGLYISIGQKLLANEQKAKEIIRMLPLEKMFMETDDDEMGIEEIYQKVAEIKGVPIVDLKEGIRDNILDILGKGMPLPYQIKKP